MKKLKVTNETLKIALTAINNIMGDIMMHNKMRMDDPRDEEFFAELGKADEELRILLKK